MTWTSVSFEIWVLKFYKYYSEETVILIGNIFLLLLYTLDSISKVQSDQVMTRIEIYADWIDQICLSMRILRNCHNKILYLLPIINKCRVWKKLDILTPKIIWKFIEISIISTKICKRPSIKNVASFFTFFPRFIYYVNYKNAGS